jgi:acylphosphatase
MIDQELQNMLRMSCLVSGDVQGVGYRRYVQRLGLDYGLVGYAENLSDGRVEVIAEGHKIDLERLLHWVKKGPPHAVVEAVDVEWSAVTGLEGFYCY